VKADRGFVFKQSKVIHLLITFFNTNPHKPLKTFNGTVKTKMLPSDTQSAFFGQFWHDF